VNRLTHFFKNRNGRKVLSLFITAGYPSLDSTVPIVIELIKAGADIIEIGIPFSDPIADGPVIQQSSETALRNGITLQRTFGMVNQIRKHTAAPILLMGYANPFFAFGLELLMKTSAEIGIDGIIIADLSLEESEDYRGLAREHDIATIFLAAPTSSDERLAELDKCSKGFLYCVSAAGVTGEQKSLPEEANDFLRRAGKCVKNNPTLVGFGISTSENARSVIRLTDGVIIGSALIKLIRESRDNHLSENVINFVHSFRTTLDLALSPPKAGR